MNLRFFHHRLNQPFPPCLAAVALGLACWTAFPANSLAMGSPPAPAGQATTAPAGKTPAGGGDSGGPLETAGGVLGNDAVGESMNQGAQKITTKAGQANIQSRLSTYFGDADAGKLQQQAQNLSRASKIINGGTAIIGHAGWVATAAGNVAEGDYAGAAIQAGSGFGKTVATGWAAVKGGAVGFAAGGPVGAFIGAVGSAWVAGTVYDATVQRGADYLNQRAVDYQTGKNLRGDDASRQAAREAARNAGQEAARGAIPPPPQPPISPPTGGGSPGGGCGGPCGR